METGFDIVLGNPPYVDSETMTNIGLEKDREYIVQNYKFISGNWDIYMAFLEKGLDLTKNILCYITPDKWLSKPFGSKFREKCMMPKMSKVLHVGSNVFENVRVDGIVSLFLNKSDNLTTLKFDKLRNINTVNTISKQIMESPFLIDSFFSENYPLINKIEYKSAKKISDYANCEGACATNDAYNLVSLIENNSNYNKDKDYILINTGTLEKYNHRWGRKEITYLGRKILNPIVNKQTFKNSFGKSYIQKANSPKIILKGLNLLDGCIDFDGYILQGKSTLVILNDNPNILKFLCALINSRLAIFYIKTKYSSSSYCGGITFTKEMINNFPIPDISKEQQPIIEFVDKILSAKQANPTADTTNLEKEIDKKVYELYSLTEEEIAIIEK